MYFGQFDKLTENYQFVGSIQVFRVMAKMLKLE